MLWLIILRLDVDDMWYVCQLINYTRVPFAAMYYFDGFRVGAEK